MRIGAGAAGCAGTFALALAILACGGERGEPAAVAQTDAQTDARQGAAPTDVVTADAHGDGPEVEPAAARRKERPLPAFSGRTLAGKQIEIGSYIGKRLIIAFWNPEVAESAIAVDALNRIAPLRGKHNFEIVGVAVGSNRETAATFANARGIEYPVIDDSRGDLVRRFGLRSPVTLLGVDAEGYLVFGSNDVTAMGEDGVVAMESQLRKDLRLPAAAGDPRDTTLRPKAPLFTAEVLDGERFELAAHSGEPVVLLFFLHTCSHCHEVLAYLKKELDALPKERRPLLVGLELTGKTYSVRARLQQDGFDFFPVLFDHDASIQKAYGVFAGVPDLVLIDREGRIAARVQGWEEAVDGPLLRMRLARLVGAPVPMLLSEKGYTGSEVCGVCHQREHETWQLTRHADAFDTLVKHAADTKSECVGCHVVGFDEPGGFEIARSEWLEDVGCESCHGRGGPHLSTDLAKGGSYSEACLGCHDTKHSLGFEYGKFLPRISHAANAAILALPPAERERVLAERGAVRESLLPTTAAHVGSEACRSCHAAEFETWSAGPHAHAVEKLVSAGKQAESDCLRCHTTAMGSDGGFPSGGDVAVHDDLARVGCESCHGPGGDHVTEDAAKIGSIVSLGDKCDSCVILQICGSCHDDANDPGFEFEVLGKIEKIRHGTIEAGTGKPLPPKGSRQAHARDHAAAVFAWLDADRGAAPPAANGIHP